MRRARQRGIALVLVTWVFMILGVLALDFARYMRDDAVAALNLAEETRNYYVAVGAMNRAIYDLEQDEGGAGGDDGASASPARPTRLAARRGTLVASCRPGDDEAACTRRKAAMEDEEDDGGDDEEDGGDGSDPGDGEQDEDDGLTSADGEWHEEVLGGARYGVRVVDEGGLISLNDAAEEPGAPLLRHVVKNLLGYGGTAGTDRRGEAAVSTVVDSIVDWYDRDDQEGINGAESAFYLGREPAYPAKNADFDSVEELLLVRGVTPALFYGGEGVPGLKDLFTPYVKAKGDHPKINVRRAPPAVLQALLGIDAEEAAALVELREEQDPNVFLAQVVGSVRSLDPTLAEKILVGSGSPKVVRVEARADVSVPRNQARVAAIVELSSEVTEGVRVIRWFDRAPWEGALPTGSGDRPA